MNTENILIVDDNSDALLSLTRALKACGVKSEINASSEANKAFELFQLKKPEVVVLDLHLNEEEGVEAGFNLISKMLPHDITCRIIVLTGHSSIEYGVKALKLGAANFIEKPADIDHLAALIKDGIKQSNIKRAYDLVQNEKMSAFAKMIIGQSESVEKLRENIDFASKNNQPVLITGETGTGKGLCALAIHKASSRSSKNFVRYQTNFSTSDMVNSDLFGHIKGSFTGAIENRKGLVEEASHGTLFLDEIDEIPLETQVMLLGILQDKKYRSLGSNKELDANFRLICAANQDINKSLETGKIRSDFYHRIAHLAIHLDPLRARISDIPLLVENILLKMRETEQSSVFEISKAALAGLMNFEWPGNIRQLEAIVEGAAYRAQYNGRSFIEVQDLNLKKQNDTETSQSFNEKIKSYKKKLIQEKLLEVDGNHLKAAKLLGIDRATIRRVLEE